MTVQFIGSHYSTTLSSDSLRVMTARELEKDDDDNDHGGAGKRTANMVQARLLFSIALHARYEVQEGEVILGRAVQLALEIGLHKGSYCFVNGVQDPVEEESLRRTWWELFVVDGYMAALHRKTTFKARSVQSADVPLPCEESVYAESGGAGGNLLPTPLTLAQFDARLFSEEGDELQFSSYCYRIDAVRILGRVISVSRAQHEHEPHPDEVQAVDNALVGWIHHLPAGKSEIIDTYGELDEMIFQARMIISYASIYLHGPRSDLNLPAVAELACGQSDGHTSPTETQHMHAIIATDASKQLSSLAALRSPVRRHTPLFICALVLSAMVQLSACVVHHPARGRQLCTHELHRDRVGLVVGVLKSLTQTWALAQNALRLIRKVARDVLEEPSLANGDTNRTSCPQTMTTPGGVIVEGVRAGGIASSAKTIDRDSGVDVRGGCLLDDGTTIVPREPLPWMDDTFDGLQDLIHLDNNMPCYPCVS
jgi:hypothetical protein